MTLETLNHLDIIWFHFYRPKYESIWNLKFRFVKIQALLNRLFWNIWKMCDSITATILDIKWLFLNGPSIWLSWIDDRSVPTVWVDGPGKSNTPLPSLFGVNTRLIDGRISKLTYFPLSVLAAHSTPCHPAGHLVNISKSILFNIQFYVSIVLGFQER